MFSSSSSGFMPVSGGSPYVLLALISSGEVYIDMLPLASAPSLIGSTAGLSRNPVLSMVDRHGASKLSCGLSDAILTAQGNNQ